jgi:penicillin-binding protein 1B
MDEPLGVRPSAGTPRVAPYFVDYVREELRQAYDPAVLTQEGLQIHTSLDAELQRAAEAAVEAGLRDLESRFEWLAPQEGQAPLEASLVAIQPQTGEIRAMVGGRQYGQSQFNRAARGRRQVGSLFKPVVFAAAVAHGRADGGAWLPTSRIDDQPFEWEYDAQSWKPANYADRYFGLVTVRESLERSLNAATARAAHEVGLPAILATAERLGFEGPLPQVPAIVLGAGEATPLQVARVYATLANGGLRPTLLATRRITTADGRVVERRGVHLERAIDPAVAFTITHMLRGVIERGTGQSAGFEVPAAGKTGTTDGYRDAWFAGYTPDLVTVVWVGFDQERALGLTGSGAALPIWAEFMKMATAGYPGTPFRPPPGVVLTNIDPQTGGLATPLCPEVIEEVFPVDLEPDEECPAHSSSSFTEVDAPLPGQGEAPPGEPPAPRRERRWLPWPF